MSRRQAPDPLDLMRRSDPVDAAAMRAELDEPTIAAAMARAIGMAGEPIGTGTPDPVSPSATIGPRRRRRPALALAAALVVLIAAVLLVTGAFSGGGSHPTYAAAAIEVAEANPRLLVTAPGWKVTDAGEHFEMEDGEMRFGDGSRTLTLNWYPGRYYRSYLRDRAQVSPPRRSRLLGRTATTVEYARGEYATMLAPIGRVFVEVRGQLGDRAHYEAVLHSLRRVDVDTWLAAMPASVVGPDTRAPAVERMLGGLPYPPGFDPGALEGETAVLDHYELGVRVASAVACGWVESWLAARRSGDAQAARDAVDAMAGSRRWPLLVQMEREVPGGWAHNVWTVAAGLRAGHLDQGFAGALVRPDGGGYRLGPAWAVGLECHSSIRKVPFDGR
jgi:hypothetical protein